MLRVFGKNKLYLKNAHVIETLAKVDTIVFDKTGTITQSKSSEVDYEGTPLTAKELIAVRGIASQSSHPLSKMIASSLHHESERMLVESFKEYTGKGLEAKANNIHVRLGSADFIGQFGKEEISYCTGTHVHVMMDDVHKGKFTVRNQYRQGIAELARRLHTDEFDCFVLSGDNAAEENKLQRLFSDSVRLQFNQSPQQKLDFIKQLQQSEKKVLMLGDGLNDAGALMQSNVGIAVSGNTSQFSPACDAILDGCKVQSVDKFIAYAKSGKSIVTASFVLSILYNIVGLSFAVQGILSPMVAAILMPASSISIVLLVTALSSLSARFKRL